MFTPEFLQTWGYIGLFIACFLAATVVPFSSEVVLIAMHQMGFNFWGILVVATLGNYSGLVSTYFVGRLGGNYLIERWIKPDPSKRARVEALYDRWGEPILFFSFLPIIGDLFAVVSGLLHGRLLPFTLWVLAGQFGRYWLVLSGSSLFLNR